MTFIPITSIVLNSDGSWIFFWPNLGQSFSRVILWGIELARSNSLSYTWQGAGGTEYGSFPPPLEIAFENQLVTTERFQPYLIVQWYGEPLSQSYTIQQYINGSWVTIGQVQEVGQWIYTYITTILADETTYKYQVIAIDNVGNVAQGRLYQKYVVSSPIPPDGQVTVSYVNPNIIITMP